MTDGERKATIEDCERLIAVYAYELRSQYEARKGKQVDERWCIGCGARRVTGQDPRKPDRPRSSCDPCLESYDQGKNGSDPVAEIIARL
jgi:hypothetical protein